MKGRKPKYAAGMRFGAWEIIEKGTKPAYWVCRCECGTVREVSSSGFASGKSVSCGCGLNPVNIRPREHHGMSQTRTYKIWKGMRGRCFNNHNPKYKDYGGRGITVCDRWKSFQKFIEDMGEAPDECSIDRYPDVNGNYDPDNCRWATYKEQGETKRRNGPAVQDWVGRRYGRWLIEAKTDPDKHGNKRWWCICECGTRKTRSVQSIKYGAQSCGCDRRKS